LTEHHLAAAQTLRHRVSGLLDVWLDRATDAGQVARVAGRFALVAAAGELATDAGITGWSPGEASGAALQMLNDWLAARGTRGDAEALAAVRQVATLLNQHAESYFPWWHRGADDRRPNAPKRWGFRKIIDAHDNEIDSQRDRDGIYGTETITEAQGEAIAAKFYVMVSAFRAELCRGFDPRHVARVLHQRGYLVPESEKRLDRKERLPGIGEARCYVIKPELFGDDAL
jgi:putative DNA primase/helicase